MKGKFFKFACVSIFSIFHLFIALSYIFVVSIPKFLQMLLYNYLQVQIIVEPLFWGEGVQVSIVLKNKVLARLLTFKSKLKKSIFLQKVSKKLLNFKSFHGIEKLAYRMFKKYNFLRNMYYHKKPYWYRNENYN